MTELQMGLIGLGVVAVAGVVVYNQWQEKKHRRLAEEALQGERADVLLEREEAARREPELAGEQVPAAPGRIEPVLGAAGEAPETAAPPPWTPPAEPAVAVPAADLPPVEGDAGERSDPPPALVSPAIDYVAGFELVEPVSGEQILASQCEALARIRRPLRWAGFNEQRREWEGVSETGAYRRLRVGLLLASRQGPLPEAELAVFQGAMQGLADELMAVADLPPRREALAAAVALDQFCADVDIQIGINVIAGGQSFAGTKIRALAEAAGMVLSIDGRFVRCDDDGRVLYTLNNYENVPFSAEAMKTLSTHGLTFLLDVPRVAHGDRVFVQMVDLARRFAEALHGTVVDDNRQPLSEAMLEPIRRQIGQYQSVLAGRGLAAGGPLALRLFV